MTWEMQVRPGRCTVRGMPRPSDATLAEKAELLELGLARCRTCTSVLPIDSFGSYKGRRRDHCKPCVNDRMSSYARAAKEKDPEAYRARRAVYSKRHRDGLDPVEKADQVRRNNLKRNYGVTPEWVDDTLIAQGGCCGICGSTTTAGRNWHVDHDHKTGEIRGVLCATCNVGLGAFADDPARLRAAAEYLERSSGSVGPAEVPAESGHHNKEHAWV